MSFLEDRILRILELKISGLDNKRIAERLNLDKKVIENYESSIKRTIYYLLSHEKATLEGISIKLGISPVTLEMITSFYEIEIPEETNEEIKKVHRRRSIPESVTAIREAMKRGITNADEIAEAVNLSEETVRIYGRRYKLNIPHQKRNQESKYKREIEIMTKAVKEDINSYDKLVEITGLPKSKLYYISHHYGIEITREKKEVPTKLITRAQKSESMKTKIRETIEKGILSVEKIAEEVNASTDTVYGYISRMGIDLWELRKEKTISTLNKVIEEGKQITAETVENFSSKTGIKPHTIIRYASDEGIQIKDITAIKRSFYPIKHRRKTIDRLIQEGASIVEIESIAKVTRQLVEQYIKGTDQYETWKYLRNDKKKQLSEQKKLKKERLGELAYILEARLVKLAEKESWPYQKAIEYLLSRKIKQRINLDTLIKIFERYENAGLNNEDISYERLGQEFSMYPSQVKNILNRVSVRTIHPQLVKTVTSNEKKEAIKRSTILEMSSNDIAYFLHVKPHTFNYMLNRENLQRKATSNRSLIINIGYSRLTYRLASQIYEAKDTGFSDKEVSELLNTNLKIVEGANKNRKDIEQKIIKALRVLYSDETINSPYIKNK